MTQDPNRQERRRALRVPVSVDVVLYYNSLMLHDCSMRDLSADGAFIVTGGQTLPDRAYVDLAFAAPAADGQDQRFGAEVVRFTDEGVGVLLRQADPARLRVLATALYAA